MTYKPGCSCNPISAAFSIFCTHGSFHKAVISSESAHNILLLCPSSPIRTLSLRFEVDDPEDDSPDFLPNEKPCLHPDPERSAMSVALAGL